MHISSIENLPPFRPCFPSFDSKTCKPRQDSWLPTPFVLVDQAPQKFKRVILQFNIIHVLFLSILLAAQKDT